jgi:putative ABC transport system permease protein
VSLATGVFFGILPALASKVDLASSMKQGATGNSQSGRRRLAGGLIVAQVAVSVVLLTGAGLLLASFYRLQNVDPGYRSDQVTSAEIFTNFSRYPNLDTQLRMYLPLLERLQGASGVISAAITNAVPLSTLQPGNVFFQIEGRLIDNPEARPVADSRIVSSDYFKTLGIPLLQGRSFAESDGRDAPAVVVINKSMMRYWEGKDPIGSRISTDNGQTWTTVVGIAGDVKQFGLDRETVAQVHVPLRQTSRGDCSSAPISTPGPPPSSSRTRSGPSTQTCPS